MRVELADSAEGILPDEGGGDAGLFKGILIRYATEAIKVWPESAEAAGWLTRNANVLWEQGKTADGALFGTDWKSRSTSDAIIQLSSQLSGVMLLECAAVLEQSAEQASGSDEETPARMDKEEPLIAGIR